MRKQVRKIAFLVALFVGIMAVGVCVSDAAQAVDFTAAKLSPSWQHLFGTDSYGRDVFFRTLSGLSRSLLIGIAASLVSGILALIVGMIAGIGPKWIDSIVNFIIDAVLSIPHLVLLILISFCLGKGLFGVVVGIICTHWTGLARVIRAEVLQLKEEQYVQISRKYGMSKWFIATRHILPHVIPQFVIGVVILFPHAILHESAVTFLGFGLPPEIPTIGILLSESMEFIMSGMWWLFLPGVCLVMVVLLFNQLGKNLKKLYEYEYLRGE